MYSSSQLRKGIRHPKKALNKIKRDFDRFRNSWQGVNFLDEDWDNLILLDACRYDLFEEVNTIDGDLSKVKSNSSSSDEFFEKNIDGKKHGNIVYYSANPHIDNIDASFYDLYRLWELDWDEETGTVLPNEAVDRVLDTAEKYDDKRLIVHLMQPHRPFLGDKAENFEQSGFARQGVNIDYGENPDVPFWWDRMEEGELDRESVWPLYKETLEVALPHVERLVGHLKGKSVISADHGNMFGKDDIYGHPSYLYHRDLVSVPWLEIEKPRKSICDGRATENSEKERFNEAEERLEALGYV